MLFDKQKKFFREGWEWGGEWSFIMVGKREGRVV